MLPKTQDMRQERRKELQKERRRKQKDTADMCILLAVAAIAILVFIVCGSIAAASRGFVFGVGGEALLGGAVVFGLFRFWKKIKKHLD